MMGMRWPFALAIAAALHAVPARAQVETREGIYLQNQILELRQQFQQMSQIQGQVAPPVPAPADGEQGAAPSAGGNDAVAQLLVRVTELEDQVRSLQGKIAEMSNQQQHDHDELNKKIDDLAFKTGHGAVPAPAEGGALGGGAPGGIGPDPQATNPGAGADTAPPEAPPPPVKPPPRRSAEQAWKTGSAALARRDYLAASAAANEVLALPANKYTGDARYLLGRAQLGEHKYKEAMASFYPIYKAAPKTARGGDALLGVTNALIGMDNLKIACQVAAKVSVEFANYPSLRDGAAQARKRARCA